MNHNHRTPGTMHIIKYIGASGVRTIPFESLPGPLPGDPVDFPENAPYPWNVAKSGRIHSVDGAWEGKGSVHICCSGGSVFLQDDMCVEISGGPFAVAPKADLVFSGKFRAVSFWNWGDNRPGANQGVTYMIVRPVYLLRVMVSLDDG